MEKRKGISRFGVLYPSYVVIAMKEFFVFQETEKAIEVAEELFPGSYQVDVDLETRLHESYFKVVVFSSLAIEAYIYDVAAIELTDNYVKTHLDKLSLVDKYVVVPKLICGRDVDKSGEWFHLLTKLVRERNELVHSKSKHLDLSRLRDDPEYWKLLTKDRNDISPKEAIKVLFLIDEMISEFSTLEHGPPYLASKATVISSEKHGDIYRQAYEAVFA